MFPINQEVKSISRFCDITKKEKVRSLIVDYEPDLVVCCSASSKPLDSWASINSVFETNILGMNNIINAIVSERPQAKLVFISSSDIYAGNSLELPISEQSDLHPISPYGISKLATEKTIELYRRQFGLRYLIVRPFQTFSIFKTRDFLSDICHQIKEQLTVSSPKLKVGDLKLIRDFISAEGAVDAITFLISKNIENEIVNICSGVPLKLEDVVKFVLEEFNLKAKLDIDRTLIRPGEGHFRVGDNSKLMKFGWLANENIYKTVRTVAKSKIGSLN